MNNKQIALECLKLAQEYNHIRYDKLDKFSDLFIKQKAEEYYHFVNGLAGSAGAK